jgi:hypothetical protein
LNNSVEIRLELLKKVGEGNTKRETVKYLVNKFGITEQTAYYHFRTRDKWLSQYCDFNKDFVFQVQQRFNHVYREASFQYLHAKEDNARIGYLRTMLEANSKLGEYVSKDAKNNIDKITLQWKERSDSIQEALRQEKQFDEWCISNLSPEERNMISQVKRFLFLFEVENMKDSGEIQ